MSAEDDLVAVPRDVLEAVVGILEIAADWNAPLFYEVDVPNGWTDTLDEGSAEPGWVALYLFTPKLRELLTPNPGEHNERE